jgi:hypothetical protein
MASRGHSINFMLFMNQFQPQKYNTVTINKKEERFRKKARCPNYKKLQ